MVANSSRMNALALALIYANGARLLNEKARLNKTAVQGGGTVEANTPHAPEISVCPMEASDLRER